MRTRYPRIELADIGDTRLTESLKPLEWTLIKERIRALDYVARGGVSADATLIAELVLDLFNARWRTNGDNARWRTNWNQTL